MSRTSDAVNLRQGGKGRLTLFGAEGFPELRKSVPALDMPRRMVRNGGSLRLGGDSPRRFDGGAEGKGNQPDGAAASAAAGQAIRPGTRPCCTLIRRR